MPADTEVVHVKVAVKGTQHHDVTQAKKDVIEVGTITQWEKKRQIISNECENDADGETEKLPFFKITDKKSFV